MPMQSDFRNPELLSEYIHAGAIQTPVLQNVWYACGVAWLKRCIYGWSLRQTNGGGIAKNHDAKIDFESTGLLNTVYSLTESMVSGTSHCLRFGADGVLRWTAGAPVTALSEGLSTKLRYARMWYRLLDIPAANQSMEWHLVGFE